MRVVVREAFKAYINHQPENFHVGQKIKGDTAVLLLRTRAAVDPEDEEAAELADSLEDKSEDDDQEQETEQPLTPSTPAVVPVDIPGGGANPLSPPGPGTELDTDASVADVLTWVGDDAERAALALAAEQAKASPRSTLVKPLQKIADPGA
ncbi:hypothetical protein OG742_37120 [Streptomyces sp. NBC_00828]|uniref:hypothetical protein n=1 Tax=Streptomyces sp. NBC_00828 TaxID=2903678 RepID=UPI0038677588